MEAVMDDSAQVRKQRAAAAVHGAQLPLSMVHEGHVVQVLRSVACCLRQHLAELVLLRMPPSNLFPGWGDVIVQSKPTLVWAEMAKRITTSKCLRLGHLFNG
jgi:hypothetical protein